VPNAHRQNILPNSILIQTHLHVHLCTRNLRPWSLSDKFKSMFEGSTRYEIPVFQRGYSWKAEHVETFFKDLTDADEQDNTYTHFFGFMITTNDDPTLPLTFIDGQQRMTTAMLFLVCMRNHLYKHYINDSPEINRRIERLEQFLFSSINAKDPKSSTPRLCLSRPNRELFRVMVVDSNITDTILKKYAAENESNALLFEAYGYFKSMLKKRGHETASDLKTTYELVDSMLNKFTVYKQNYTDRKEAQRIFDLVNYRGRNIEESDIIKNFLFSELARSENNPVMTKYDKIWTKIINNVTNLKTKAKIDSFLHYYLIASSGYVSAKRKPDKKRMYDTIKDLVEHRARSSQTIISELHDWSIILRKVRNPETCKEFAAYPNIVYYLAQFKALDIKFGYATVLAAYKQYWEQKNSSMFETILMIILKCHIRIKILYGKIPLLEQINNDLAANINNGKPLKTMLYDLLKDYPRDTTIKDILQDKTLKNSAVAKVVLMEIEHSNGKQRNLDTVEIEHIMPKTLSKDWESYIMRHNGVDARDPKHAKDSVHNIFRRHLNYVGNLTLLEASANRPGSNKPFDAKKNFYATSQYRITRDLKKFQTWNQKAITARQADLAEQLMAAIDLEQIYDAL